MKIGQIARKRRKAPPTNQSTFHIIPLLGPLHHQQTWRGRTYRSRTWRDVQNAGDSVAPPSPSDALPPPVDVPDTESASLSADFRLFPASSSDSELPRLSDVVLPWSDQPRSCCCGPPTPPSSCGVGLTRVRFADRDCAASMNAHSVEASSSACPGGEIEGSAAEDDGAVRVAWELLTVEEDEEVEDEDVWRECRAAGRASAGAGVVVGVIGVLATAVPGSFGQWLLPSAKSHRAARYSGRGSSGMDSGPSSVQAS